MTKRSNLTQVTLPAPRREPDAEPHTRHVLDAVAAQAVGPTPVQSALQATLDALCDEFGFPVAHAYVLDETQGRLQSTPLWHVSDPSRFATLVRHTSTTPVLPGVGLVGRALESAQPVWVRVIHDDPLFRRSHIALTAGLRAAFAFPVVAGGRVVAVVEVLAPRHLEDDPDLAELVHQVSWLLGTIFSKARTLVPQ